MLARVNPKEGFRKTTFVDMSLSRRRIASPLGLKALAHPLRVELLDLLLSEGPRTATQAAQVTGASPSNCSWHLRKLAEQGFVREVADRTGRNRPWRAVTEALPWAREDERADSAAVEGIADLRLERELQRYRAARSQRASEPPEWQKATGLQHARIWMTPQEAQDVTDYLAEVLHSGTTAAAGAADRSDEARLVSVVSWLVPAGPVEQPQTNEKVRADEKARAEARVGPRPSSSRPEPASSRPASEPDVERGGAAPRRPVPWPVPE